MRIGAAALMILLMEPAYAGMRPPKQSEPPASIQRQEEVELQTAYHTHLPSAIGSILQATANRAAGPDQFSFSTPTTAGKGSYHKQDLEAAFTNTQSIAGKGYKFSITLKKSADPPFFAFPHVNQIVVELRKEGSPYCFRQSYLLDNLLAGEKRLFDGEHESIGKPECAAGEPLILGKALGTRYLCVESGTFSSSEQRLRDLAEAIIAISPNER
jgi:hypothetical protein